MVNVGKTSAGASFRILHLRVPCRAGALLPPLSALGCFFGGTKAPPYNALSVTCGATDLACGLGHLGVTLSPLTRSSPKGRALSSRTAPHTVPKAPSGRELAPKATEGECVKLYFIIVTDRKIDTFVGSFHHFVVPLPPRGRL